MSVAVTRDREGNVGYAERLEREATAYDKLARGLAEQVISKRKRAAWVRAQPGFGK